MVIERYSTPFNPKTEGEVICILMLPPLPSKGDTMKEDHYTDEIDNTPYMQNDPCYTDYNAVNDSWRKQETLADFHYVYGYIDVNSNLYKELSYKPPSIKDYYRNIIEGKETYE